MLGHNPHADPPVITFELGIDKEIPPYYKGDHDLRVLFNSLITLYR